MKETRIKIESKNHGLAVLKYLEALGYAPSSSAVAQGVNNAKQYFERWTPEAGSFIGINQDGRFTSWGGTSSPDHVEESEFFEYARLKAEKFVVLNKNYTAEITKNGVKVGCQTFTFEKVLELAEVVKSFKE